MINENNSEIKRIHVHGYLKRGKSHKPFWVKEHYRIINKVKVNNIDKITLLHNKESQK